MIVVDPHRGTDARLFGLDRGEEGTTRSAPRFM